ncbi:MAG: PAS domain-containing protein [Hyphomicrobiales bacterium]|nr:PAS domain-containing protein [Rickettsiales bacterium]MCP5361186.1 PAS domain-containing protein [Hyphomicrobiales bacterium]
MAQERRISEQAIAYWNTLRKEGALPPFDAIKPEDIPHIWEDCFVARIYQHPETGRRTHAYLRIGENIRRMVEGDLASEMSLLVLDNLTQKYRYVTDNCSAAVDQSERKSADGKRVIKYRQAIAPLGTDDGNVTHILVAMRYLVADVTV